MLQVILRPVIAFEARIWLLSLLPQQLQSFCVLPLGLIQYYQLTVLPVL